MLVPVKRWWREHGPNIQCFLYNHDLVFPSGFEPIYCSRCGFTLDV